MAREINNLPKPADFNYKNFEGPLQDYLAKSRMLLDWQDREASLKEYRIEGFHLSKGSPESFIEWSEPYDKYKAEWFYIGSPHECECNEQTLTAIIL